MKNTITFIFVAFVLYSCSPTPEEIVAQTATAQTTIAEVRTKTPTQTLTASPTPTPTPTPTSTPTHTATPTSVANFNPIFLEIPEKGEIVDILDYLEAVREMDLDYFGEDFWFLRPRDIGVLGRGEQNILDSIVYAGYHTSFSPNAIFVFSPVEGQGKTMQEAVTSHDLETEEKIDLEYMGAESKNGTLMFMNAYPAESFRIEIWQNIVYSTLVACREARGGCPRGVKIFYQRGYTLLGRDHSLPEAVPESAPPIVRLSLPGMTLEEALAFFCDSDYLGNKPSEEEVRYFFERFVNNEMSDDFRAAPVTRYKSGTDMDEEGRSILFFDDFSDRYSGWGIGTIKGYRDGRYFLYSPASQTATYNKAFHYIDFFRDPIAEVTIQIEEDVEEADFGFIWQGLGSELYNTIGITNDGKYIFRELGNDRLITESTDAFKTGQTSYLLAVEWTNESFILYVDGEEVTTISGLKTETILPDMKNFEHIKIGIYSVLYTIQVNL